MILDMWSMYSEYLDQTNKVDKKRDKIHIYAFKLKREFYISNEEKK